MAARPPQTSLPPRIPPEPAYDDAPADDMEFAGPDLGADPAPLEAEQSPALMRLRGSDPAQFNRPAPARRAKSPPAEGHRLAALGLQKSFGSRRVVNGVSLSVERGEAVGLLGPNCAGKTTVCYMITGLLKAD